MPRADLSTFYYHDHFIEMLDAVEQAYAHILDEAHTAFIGSFRRLPRPAQCLFIRMANRKGELFHCQTLAYAEIEHKEALAQLAAHGFTRELVEGDHLPLLGTLNKAALLALAAFIEAEAVKASWAKAKIVAHLHLNLPFARLLEHVEAEAYVVCQHKKLLDYLLYLYFGRTFRDLKSFALRDLGVIAVNRNATFAARFADRAEAEACFRYTSLLACLKDANEPLLSSMIKAIQAPAVSPYAEQLRAQLASEIGARCEKLKQVERAIAVYRLVNAPESNERLVRLLYAGGQQDEARVLLERLIDDPGSDREYDFATDFYARKFGGQRVGSCTALLRDATTIVLDDIHRTMPETGAIACFRQEGWRAYWTENGFWHALFGLLFWPELFGEHAPLHSSFDGLPHCLADGTFKVLFASRISYQRTRP